MNDSSLFVTDSLSLVQKMVLNSTNDWNCKLTGKIDGKFIRH